MCMRNLCILFLIFLFACPVLGCNIKKNNPITHSDGTIEYDFSKQKQAKASKILYKYILKDMGKTPKEARDFANITPQNVSAFETDLNGDGKKEIIGVVFGAYYWGTAGNSLFILEGSNNNYQDITYILNFEPLEKFYVLKSKTNNYKDIKFYGSSAYNFKPMVANFNKYKYVNLEQIELLEQYMRDFSGFDVSDITGVKE